MQIAICAGKNTPTVISKISGLLPAGASTVACPFLSNATRQMHLGRSFDKILVLPGAVSEKADTTDAVRSHVAAFIDAGVAEETQLYFIAATASIAQCLIEELFYVRGNSRVYVQPKVVLSFLQGVLLGTETAAVYTSAPLALEEPHEFDTGVQVGFAHVGVSGGTETDSALFSDDDGEVFDASVYESETDRSLNNDDIALFDDLGFDDEYYAEGSDGVDISGMLGGLFADGDELVSEFEGM